MDFFYLYCISNIICGKCLIKNKGNSANHEFYKCLTCNRNLCVLCRSNHSLNHKIIDYDTKNYVCQKHNEPFIKYCKECKKNTCFSCDEEHREHKTIFLGDIMPNIEESKNKLAKIKKEIELFNDKIKDIIKQLNELIDTMNIYYKINNDLFNSYQIQNRSYQILKNIKKINMDNEIFKAVCDINQITNMKDKLSNIIDLYNKINSDKINNKPLPNSTFLRKKDDLKIYIFPSLKFIIKNSLSSINDISECMQISKQINRKILLLLGEVGVGKTTLLNSFINALYEIQFEDNFRYILSDELNNNNGTEYINIYNIDSFKNNPPITIIDTPGFGKGIEFDENINEMIKKLINNYIEHINAICLIFNGSNLKLSSNQQKIINNILKFFGNDL